MSVQATSLDLFRTQVERCPLCGEVTVLFILCGVRACYGCMAILDEILKSCNPKIVQ